MGKSNLKFINRELSWLHFNDRVLQEAADTANPLLERIRFLGIYSNNLDEFFRVRVAGLNRMIDLKGNKKEFEGINPEKILKQVARYDQELQVKFAGIYHDIVQELNRNNIYLIDESKLTEVQGVFVKRYFREQVQPNLFPVMLENVQNTSFLKDKSIYLAVCLGRRDRTLKEKYALIKVPTSVLSRFLVLPAEGINRHIILLDDVIRYCLADVFSVFDYDLFSAYTIKFTRDAELDMDNDVSKSFLHQVEESLQKRKTGQPVRFIHDEVIPETLLKTLERTFRISGKDYMVSGGRYHNFKDFMNFPALGAEELSYPRFQPLPHRYIDGARTILDVIREKDIILHFPYHSFQNILDLLRQASMDPGVRSVKITLYRLSPNSKIINALINAARNGKKVTVFLELQARFDEEANIRWSEKLQEEGVRVIQGIPGFKVHCKLLLIRRKESGKNRYYAYIGTGNFNEDTARIYADEGLLTADEKIAAEVHKVFALFEAKYKPVRFNTLIVSPFSQRNFFVRMIKKEIAHARAGRNARIIVKLNNLVDEAIVKKLYQAGQAGVKVQLIIRGICIMVPGMPQMSENIEIISVVDRFLEHSRIIYFYNNGDEQIFITSADWMIRNFDRRIEVGCPVFDESIKSELKRMLEIQLSDNTKARIISKEGENRYKQSVGAHRVRSQVEYYRYLMDLNKGEPGLDNDSSWGKPEALSASARKNDS